RMPLPMEDSLDTNLNPLRTRNYLFSCVLMANKGDHFKVNKDDSEHHNKFPKKKVKCAAGEDGAGTFDGKDTEVKAPAKKCILGTPAQNAQNSNMTGKDSEPSYQGQKVKKPSDNREKLQKCQKYLVPRRYKSKKASKVNESDHLPPSRHCC
ncbi:hypothetical protein J0S82_011510, partial [Galemys pyrenaicus]